MTDTFEILLPRLDAVRPAGTGRWVARCPAHDDKSPSLSIRDTSTRTLIHCFAGCDASDILDAVGLTWRELYGDEWKGAKEAALHQRVKLPPLDPMELERSILQLAQANRAKGKTLSIDDQARVELAIERLESANG